MPVYIHPWFICLIEFSVHCLLVLCCLYLCVCVSVMFVTLSVLVLVLGSEGRGREAGSWVLKGKEKERDIHTYIHTYIQCT
jgi:hypothetical protein